MKLFLVASKRFYPEVQKISKKLEQLGHIVTLPNGFLHPEKEAEIAQVSPHEYQKWKRDMIREDSRIVAANDAIFVINLDKDDQRNYIGGAVFLEMFKAFELGKPMYLYNPIPDSMLHDEIVGFGPIVVDQDLSKVQ